MRRGVTLVELMISMLILAIVCIAWLQIIGIQSARKEARRREAVERLAGMMDAFLYEYRETSPSVASYYMEKQGSGNAGFSRIDFKTAAKGEVHPIFEGDVSPVGYQLCVVQKSNLPNEEKFVNWGSGKWLVGKLYNRSDCLETEAGKPFFTLPVCMGF